MRPVPPGPIRGQFTFLYPIIDLCSRKIVGWEVHEVESRSHARDLVERTVWREGILDPPQVLHGDNGSPLKGATVQSLLGRLGITASFSRPRVSNDNACAEALFRTLKYSPGFPRQGFATLAAARDWVHAFSDGYNTVHRHRGIQYVTPQQRKRSFKAQISPKGPNPKLKNYPQIGFSIPWVSVLQPGKLDVIRRAATHRPGRCTG